MKTGMKPGITGVGLAVLTVLALTGCSQNTSAQTDQPSRQLSDQAAQGSDSDVRIYVYNAPGGNDLPGDGENTVIDLTGDGPAVTIGESHSDGAGNTTRELGAGYAQTGLTFNIQTGGSATGAQSSGQTAQPGATVTQSPEQKPEASVQVPISVALPGGVASGSAAGATGGGDVQLSAQQQAELRTALMKAASGDPAALDVIAKLLGLGETPAPPTEGGSE